MKKIIILHAALLLFFSTYANSKNMAFDFNASSSLSEIMEYASQITSVPNAIKSPANKKNQNIKPWTIMIFINGKNDLTNFAAKDISEMEEVGSQKNFNIVVEIGKIEYYDYDYDYDYDDSCDLDDPFAPNEHYDFDSPYYGYDAPWESSDVYNLDYFNKNKTNTWTGMRRYYIEKDNDTANITSPLLQELDTHMGSWEHLADFGIWAKTNFPAEKYMLIVWSHGDGWKKPDLTVDLSFNKGISQDNTTGNEISPADLGKALRKMGGVDIYASD
ncbi:MAG: hypothetical protein KAJ48_02345, partial [Elusimicrobiales bacterium]|nr:hypothetical protein [Elusimicrobiales bacterium]